VERHAAYPPPERAEALIPPRIRRFRPAPAVAFLSTAGDGLRRPATHPPSPPAERAAPAGSDAPYIPKKNPAAYSSVQRVLASVISPSLTISSARDTGIATRSMNSS
jgi:hypothetical protein